MAEKWHQRFMESLMKRLEQDHQDKKPEESEAPRSADDFARRAVATVPPDGATVPLEPLPLHESKLGTAASASSSPVPMPSQTLERQEPPPKASVQLPYPWNLMNPAEVPDEVWQRAQAAKRNA
jgi:hypothetical protein